MMLGFLVFIMKHLHTMENENFFLVCKDMWGRGSPFLLQKILFKEFTIFVAIVATSYCFLFIVRSEDNMMPL